MKLKMLSIIIALSNLISRYRKILRAHNQTPKIILRKELLNRFKKKNSNWILLNIHKKNKESKKNLTSIIRLICWIKTFRAVMNYVKKEKEKINLLCLINKIINKIK